MILLLFVVLHLLSLCQKKQFEKSKIHRHEQFRRKAAQTAQHHRKKKKEGKDRTHRVQSLPQGKGRKNVVYLSAQCSKRTGYQ